MNTSYKKYAAEDARRYAGYNKCSKWITKSSAMTFSLASVPVGISRLKWPVKYTIKSSSAFYLYFLSIKKRLNVMIPFNLFNILYAFMTMIYILWILIFLLINGRIHWPGSSDRPGCAGPRADGVPVSSGQRLFWHWPENWRQSSGPASPWDSQSARSWQPASPTSSIITRLIRQK